MRRRVIVGGAAAAGLAYEAGKHRGQGQAEAEYAEQPEPQTQYVPPPPSAPVADTSDADELQRLAQLHADGILTDEEFTKAKAKVIGG